MRADAAAYSGKGRKSKRKVNTFDVGDEVLVAHDLAFNKTLKWAAIESCFCEPCLVTKADYLQY